MKDFLLLDEMLDKQKIHLNKAFEEGYKEGYKDGYDKGYAEVKTSIDKIRAEIEEERKGYPPSADYYKAINKVLDIIYKHIGDKE